LSDDRFAQDGPPRMTRDAHPDVIERYRDVVDALNAVFAERDPIGISYSFNPDEYEAESRTIVARLASAQHELTEDDVRVIVHEEFCRWFDPEMAGPSERYSDAARDVLHAWRERADEPDDF